MCTTLKFIRFHGPCTVLSLFQSTGDARCLITGCPICTVSLSVFCWEACSFLIRCKNVDCMFTSTTIIPVWMKRVWCNLLFCPLELYFLTSNVAHCKQMWLHQLLFRYLCCNIIIDFISLSIWTLKFMSVMFKHLVLSHRNVLQELWEMPKCISEIVRNAKIYCSNYKKH
jgi:hypothetical protein